MAPEFQGEQIRRRFQRAQFRAQGRRAQGLRALPTHQDRAPRPAAKKVLSTPPHLPLWIELRAAALHTQPLGAGNSPRGALRRSSVLGDRHLDLSGSAFVDLGLATTA